MSVLFPEPTGPLRKMWRRLKVVRDVADRDQKIVWMANPVGGMDEAVKQVEASLQGQPAQTYHYPTKVVNRVVNWWVNKVRPRPA